MDSTNLFLNLAVISFFAINGVTGVVEIIYAINAGGPTHTDIYGITYQRDPLHGKVGTASDYGKQFLMIRRVDPRDEILYKTERYHHSTFGYDIPADRDGDYVLVLKFSEVYFKSPNKKVFDVVLNGDHTIVSELDIFSQVGRGVAHDEYVPYTINGRKLYCNGQESDIRGLKIRVEFIKGYRDNPKINALYVMRGTLEEVPRLPPFSLSELEPEDFSQDEADDGRPSSPRHPDPYSMDDTFFILPVFITIGAFIPLLYCLCKL